MFKRVAGRGPRPPMGRRSKTTVATRALKDEREVLLKWPLKICYRSVVCHGAKWQRWRKANPTGSMKTFFRVRAREAARVREEMRVFWERRGAAGAIEGPPLPSASAEASTSSSDTPEDVTVRRQYAGLVAAGASDEELLAWATHREEWDFVPKADGA